MTLETLLLFPGAKDALYLLLGSGLMVALTFYRESLIYPAIQEFKAARSEFEKMSADGEIDAMESKQIAEYLTGLFDRVGAKLKR